MNRRTTLATAAFVFAVSVSSATMAQTIIDDWAKVKVPPAPMLKPVKADVRTTALLVLDFNGHETATSGPCNAATKPRCLASLAKVRDLLTKARASGMFIVYSLSVAGTPADIRPEVAPIAGEPSVKAGPDKFIGTNLRELLSAKKITTVIVTGTAAEGAVLDTGTDAALNGLDIILPVDGMSSTEPYAEQYVAWHMTAAPGVSQKTTLTRIDLISF